MDHIDGSCPHCNGQLHISKLTCDDCALSFEGDLTTPRLYRLSPEEQRFVELFVLASGSLKEMSALLKISYPTVRSRLNRLIEKLEVSRAQDATRKAEILDQIEAGRITAKRGLRMIGNL